MLIDSLSYWLIPAFGYSFLFIFHGALDFTKCTWLFLCCQWQYPGSHLPLPFTKHICIFQHPKVVCVCVCVCVFVTHTAVHPNETWIATNSIPIVQSHCAPQMLFFSAHCRVQTKALYIKSMQFLSRISLWHGPLLFGLNQFL